MNDSISCFKAYDIRGKIPDQLNQEIAYRIGRAFVDYLTPSSVVVGYDVRLTSRQLCDSLVAGLIDSGVNVINIGQCGTEEVYFATSHLGTDGGIIVTASHNPKDYNGMKLVRENSRPISSDSGLNDIKQLVEKNEFSEVNTKGSITEQDTRPAYIKHLLGYVDIDSLRPLKIVCNSGNGAAGLIIDQLEPHCPFDLVKIQHKPDGNFPNGVPNPLLIENREPTIHSVNTNQADLGIAWDGDFDRCFFFDEKGRFIEGYYIVGLLAGYFLEKCPGAGIVYDPRLIWNTIEIVQSRGGNAIKSKTGHGFIKERMRAEDAIYGGEMSAHHYFKDFFYCDSGMIPWLIVAELMTKTNKPLSELVDKRMAAFPASGEINNTIEYPAALIQTVEETYRSEAHKIDHTDGLSMSFDNWRFNLRISNTEPVVRLNVESRADEHLMRMKTDELLALIRT